MAKVKLPDGREFEVLNDFEIAAAAREGWRRQKKLDIALEMRLERDRKKVAAVHPPAVVQLPLI